MKKFRFRLEKVLSFRRMIRDEKKAVLIEVTSRLRQLESHRDAIMNELQSRQAEEMTAEMLSLYRMYKERLAVKLEEVQLNIVQVTEERRLALEAFQEAETEVKVLEKLREKKHEEYGQELLRYEQKMLDEFASRKETLAGELS